MPMTARPVDLNQVNIQAITPSGCNINKDCPSRPPERDHLSVLASQGIVQIGVFNRIKNMNLKDDFSCLSGKT